MRDQGNHHVVEIGVTCQRGQSHWRQPNDAMAQQQTFICRMILAILAELCPYPLPEIKFSRIVLCACSVPVGLISARRVRIMTMKPAISAVNSAAPYIIPSILIAAIRFRIVGATNVRTEDQRSDQHTPADNMGLLCHRDCNRLYRRHSHGNCGRRTGSSIQAVAANVTA